ncbi:hypothetical protein GCK72_023360 [Caenorhabditis remanei]|uniref:G-protein coupled receptors family 1 profile domain-containing protein n=1 Tax=Caenorhabditis remanei TaxID=31234 RepID=A0A6A5FWK9_CAERE|nr:hypothetical protein GCK72_023360 [Caenorhabditis remanei]KAF1746902.1 hypothetical protein GCK72_023360 [Caenorhabditis remanei]
MITDPNNVSAVIEKSAEMLNSVLATNLTGDILEQTTTLMSTLDSDASPLHCFSCHPKLYFIVFGLVFLSIICSGVIGNVFIVFVIIMDRKLMSSSVNQFLLNLAIADLGNLIFCSPDAILVLIDRGWLLPSFACHVLRFLQEYFLYASVLLQMAIGVERFLAICSPMRMQRFSTKTTISVLAGVWCVAACFASPYFLYQGIIFHKFYFCFWKGISHKTRMYFKYCELIVLYAIPLVFLTVLYSIMCRVLWGKEGGNHNIANHSQQEAILKLRRSVVKMLIISMLLYFLCYTPIQVLFMIEKLLDYNVQLPQWLRLLLNVLSVMSSSTNPIVYIICCRHFRLRLRDAAAALSAFCCWLFPSFTKSEYECVDETMTTKLSRSPYVSFRSSRRQNSRANLSTLL